VAERARVPLCTITATGNELAASLDRLLAIQGEPFGSTSVFAQYRVFEAARRAGVRVMLGGQGADEIFAGYRPYLAVRFGTMLRRGRVDEALRFWRNVRKLPGVDRFLRRTCAELLPASVHGSMRSAVAGPNWPAWLDRRWFERAGVCASPPLAPNISRSRLKDRLLDALQASVLPALLRYEDRNAMAFSIENRVPFLTTALADFALSLPDDYLIDRTGRSKAVLRAAMRGIVPDPVLDRVDKVAFATPEWEWLGAAGDWIANTFDSPAAARVAPLRAEEVRIRWAQRRRGSSSLPALWRAISLMRWAELADVEFVS
jgi:asparagine synthase (glutamine-hydrolysing)